VWNVTFPHRGHCFSLISPRRFPKGGAVVSLAGLSVRVQESGRTVRHRPHIDHHGRQEWRSLMYLCAMAALRVNPDLRAWRERLRERGKPGQVVMIALTRKMLHLAYGVWKNEEDYDPTWAFAVMA
jgi:transposase